jgi:hypothetical protein
MLGIQVVLQGARTSALHYRDKGSHLDWLFTSILARQNMFPVKKMWRFG